MADFIKFSHINNPSQEPIIQQNNNNIDISLHSLQSDEDDQKSQKIYNTQNESSLTKCDYQKKDLKSINSNLQENNIIENSDNFVKLYSNKN